MTTPREVLDFWFHDAHRELWWTRNDDFDAKIRERFGQATEDAATGKFDAWVKEPEGALALIILLDQFPRNLYRGSPRTWAHDAKAREMTREVLKRGHDDHFSDPHAKNFLYLPLMHSEEAEDQAQCLRLVSDRIPDHEAAVRSAHEHKAVIDRFGRFPHRNEILGRPNTPDEEEYLSDPSENWAR